MFATTAFELSWIHALQAFFDSPVGRIFVVICARDLIKVFAVAVVTLGCVRRSMCMASIRAMCSGVLAFGTAMALSPLIGRMRPFMVDPEVIRWIAMPLSTYAFPSGHASAAFGMAFGILLANRRWGWIACSMAGLIAFGRVVAGVHFLTDVLGGGLVGLIAAILVRRIAWAWSGRRTV